MKHHGRDAHWVEASDSAVERLKLQKEAVEVADCTLPYPEWRLRYSGKPGPFFRLPERHDPDTLSFREDGQ